MYRVEKIICIYLVSNDILFILLKNCDKIKFYGIKRKKKIKCILKMFYLKFMKLFLFKSMGIRLYFILLITFKMQLLYKVSLILI